MRRLAAPLLAALLLAGCADAADELFPAPCAVERPQADASWRATRPLVQVETSMGAFVAELERERAPVTVDNFLNLSASGFYNGTLVHRVVRGFVLQAGDPLSKDDDPANDGRGGPGYTIVDEFHPALRHDAAGVLSMANSGPNTGGSQFFVTLAAAPHLDDRHSVFGRVVEGMDVVRAIGEVDAPGERPAEPIRIDGVRLLGESPFERVDGAQMRVVIPEKVGEVGRAVRFAVVLLNTGNVRDAFQVELRLPRGWQCAVEPAVAVRAGSGHVAIVSVTPTADADGAHDIALGILSASGAMANATARIVVGDLGEPVERGDRVQADYVGILPDGRVFDTSVRAVAEDPEFPKFETLGGFKMRGSYAPLQFTVGSGVIAGFTELALTAKQGEPVVARVPPEKAYAAGNMYERPLTGRELVFEMEIVSIS